MVVITDNGPSVDIYTVEILLWCIQHVFVGGYIGTNVFMEFISCIPINTFPNELISVGPLWRRK